MLPSRKALYLILDKKRLRASSNLMRQKRAAFQKKDRQAPPRYRERREPRPQSARRNLLFVYVMEGDPYYPLYLFKRWKSACAQEEKVALAPTFKQRSLVLPSTFKKKKKLCMSCKRRRKLHHLLVSRFSILRKVKRPHSWQRGQSPAPSNLAAFTSW